MFLYLMDGCYDWWKEIMQKMVLFCWLHLSWKKGEQSSCTIHEQENWDSLTAGGCTRNLILISLSRGEESLFEILRVTTASSCTSHSIWSSPQCRPWPGSCLLCPLRSGMLWKELFVNDFLWSRRDNFSSIKENTSLQNLTLFFLTCFFFPKYCKVLKLL